jgi:transposase-like protein
VISDAHEGLKNAIAAVLDGASWQRCRTHFMRNLLSRVPRSAQAAVATLVRSTFAQPDAASTWAQHGRIVEQLRERFPRAADLLEEATSDLVAFGVGAALFSVWYFQSLYLQGVREMTPLAADHAAA